MFITRLKTRPDESPTARVLKAMRLDSKDIEINREGIITGAQKTRLEIEFGFKATFIGMLIMIVAVASFAFFQTAEIIPVELLLLCLAAAIGAFVVYRHKRHMATGSAVAFTGRVKKHHAPKQYLLIVIDFEDRNERIYKVAGNAYDAFVEGETYTLYSPSYWLERVISAEHHPS